MIGTAVFYRRLNMKRFVAAGGLALVLLNGGHQTHAFCQLTDCMDAAAASSGEPLLSGSLGRLLLELAGQPLRAKRFWLFAVREHC